jgi:Zn-dependent membrane protease YugP
MVKTNKNSVSMTPSIMIVSFIFLGISMLVSLVLKGKFARYSKVGLRNGLTGREIAEKMLRENGIYDVKVISVNGFLSDHYNPANKTVNLSPDVYNGVVLQPPQCRLTNVDMPFSTQQLTNGWP